MNFLKRLKRKRQKKKHNSKAKNHVSSRSVYFVVTFRQIFPWILLVMLAMLVLLFFTLPNFRVQKIECKYFEEEQCPIEILSELERLKGEHILLVDLEQTQIKLYQALPNTSMVWGSKKLPDTVNFEFFPHEEFAYIQTATGERALVLSPGLEVIGDTEILKPDLPVILYSQAFNYSLGDHVSEIEVNFASYLIELLKNEVIGFSLIGIVDHELIKVRLNDGREVHFSAAVDPDKQIESLVKVLNKLELDETSRIIDVRFDQPVIKSY